MIMSFYTCSRCHYRSNKKSSIIDHLHKKKTCPCSHTDDSRESIIYQLEHSGHAAQTCAHCQKVFASIQYLNLHQPTCISQKIDIICNKIDEQKQKLEEQQQEINELKERPSSTVININIIVNNFGQEDRSYITNDVMHKCLEDLKVVSLIENVYFNHEHPENHTIKLKSEKKGRVMLWKNDSWIEEDMNSSIDCMMEREHNNISKFFYDKVWDNPDVDFHTKAFTQSKIVQINNKNKPYFDQKRSIKARIKTFSQSRPVKT